MVRKPMIMANIHSVFRCLLLIISVSRCFGVFRYFYEPLGSFPNTTRLGTMPFFKDGLIIYTRNVSEKMDNILKNYEVLVCMHLLTDTMIRR